MTLDPSTKKVSFREEMASNCASDTESSSVGSGDERFLPSVSSVSEYSGSSNGSSGRRSGNSNTRDVRNVLTKRYSSIAFSVRGMREGQVKKNPSSRRLKR